MHIGNQDERCRRMLTEPVSRLIPSLALPSIGSMLIGALYNMADTFFVGTLGNSATGAVGIVFPITTLLQALAFIFAHGSVSCISRELGHGGAEQGEASRTASTAFFSALVLGLVYGAVGLLLMEPVLRLFGATETILPHARQYAPYIFIASPLFAGSTTLNNILRAQGRPGLALVGMSAGAILNIALDPLFILGLDMGVAGAGAATMIGQGISFFLLLFLFHAGSGSGLPIRLKEFSVGKLRPICAVGVPSFFRQGLNSLAAILLNAMAAPYGDGAIAALSVVSRITWLVFAALIGFAQAYQPVNGFNQGAGRYDRSYGALRFTLGVSVGFSLLSGLVLALWATPLVVLFRDDPEVICLGARILRAQCCTFSLQAAVTVFTMYFQTSGQGGPATFMALSRQGLCFIPLILLLPKLMEEESLVYVQMGADVLAFLITLPLALKAFAAARRAAGEYRP